MIKANKIEDNKQLDYEINGTNGTDGEKANTIKSSEPVAVMEFEDIIDSLGSFGHWQRVIFVLISLADFYGAFAMLLPVFTGATPNWICQTFKDKHNGDVFVNGSIFNISAIEKACEIKKENLTCVKTQYMDDFTSIVSQWDLVCGKSYSSDLITSIQMAGLTIGALTFGQLSDSLGRKISYFLSYSFLILSGFGSAFATSWQVYAFCRFLVGLGFGAIMVVNCVYPLEFVGRRWRTLCGTIGFWALGQCILALVAYYLRDWRHLTMATSVSGIIYYITWFFIPESPRWLVQRGRFEEAEAILAVIAKKNNKPAPTIDLLKKFARVDEAEEKKLKRYTYLDLFRTWKYCKITLIQLLAWFSCFVIYYELSYNMRKFSGNRYLNIVYAGLVDFVAMLSVIPMNNIIGRKKSFILFVVLALIGNIVLLGLFASGTDDTPGGSKAVLVFALLGKSTALAGTYVCQIFTAELFPTVIRNVGLGAAAVAGRIGGIVAPQLVYLGTFNVFTPYIVSTVLCLIVLPLILLCPETKGRALEDTLEIEVKETVESSSGKQLSDPCNTRL